MRTFKDWVIAARPWSLSASFIAAVAPIAYGFWRFQEIQYWGIAILCVFMMLVFQTAGNLLGDYADHINGVDSRNDYNGVMSMKSGKFTPGEIRAFGFAMLSLGIVIGMFIVLYTRIWWLAAFGAFGVICTAFYYWLKYHALGDVDILFLYSMVPALGIVLHTPSQYQRSHQYHSQLLQDDKEHLPETSTDATLQQWERSRYHQC